MSERYELAKKLYAEYGVDTDAAIDKLKNIPISLHCWQGDDVWALKEQSPLAVVSKPRVIIPVAQPTPKNLWLILIWC